MRNPTYIVYLRDLCGEAIIHTTNSSSECNAIAQDFKDGNSVFRDLEIYERQGGQYIRTYLDSKKRIGF